MLNSAFRGEYTQYTRLSEVIEAIQVFSEKEG